MMLRLSLGLLLAMGADSWKMSDEVFLQFWSPVSECSPANELSATCNMFGADAGFVLDNTGATCYSNPTVSQRKFFTWLGPPFNHQDAHVQAYGLESAEDNNWISPNCDERGVCSCDAIKTYLGGAMFPGDTGQWENQNASLFSYSTYQLRVGDNGVCGTKVRTTFENSTESFCGSFQGNITVTYPDVIGPPVASAAISIFSPVPFCKVAFASVLLGFLATIV
mmetsp:Transcript_5927/g.12397  ORF Transcript_5927/g.12397 Transcript_5927/m.12397 type:complete len:223 (+) Transcript_5927:159-827(+)|eukprot:CAMPEP_0194326390 /NCGR_PEP_ID=MMETSP0171-20130528/36315_1 /TAXON_ID=218684 /ORGANISM="Corethron pennatum, Strain L29A3" /LENGTH=222 /DNA_ID=CAMNT_0039085943 /DNA_START=131 /DNA_END=799 /DNA_ORIENTATION=+